MARILVVDDELSMREFLEIMLRKAGLDVATAKSGREAIGMVKAENFDLVISDIRMKDIDGLGVLRAVKDISPQTAVIMISAFATRETAVEAMREGAYDYIPKPFNVDEVKAIIENALNRRRVQVDREAVEKKDETTGFCGIIGQSRQMRRIFDLIRRVAGTRTNVYVSGESGTGKELVARAIHQLSDRKKEQFVTINCGGIPENLIESELFGYKKGAFTGAALNKQGLFEVAHRGTIFLDEVGELTPPLQVKLLRVIQEKTFKPVGDTNDIKVDIRFISATNKNLEQEVMKGNFREDFYYRLNVVQIHVPPLRERKEDVPLLADFFLNKYCGELGKDIHKLSSYAMKLLMEYNFPGNVRELENIIERGVALESSNIILPESLTLSVYKDRTPSKEEFSFDIPEEGIKLDDVMAKVERELILKALTMVHGSKQKAAELLGITLRSFRYRLEKCGLEEHLKD
ncbi:MAG: sigma-54-dependent Fis family transcriptional regulator [Deltaproteobacteria bacterium]|nr:sigma-54-dependent Fis family transcriptional regulator [Deltaproteobacteria bacterium]